MHKKQQKKTTSSTIEMMRHLLKRNKLCHHTLPKGLVYPEISVPFVNFYDCVVDKYIYIYIYIPFISASMKSTVTIR